MLQSGPSVSVSVRRGLFRFSFELSRKRGSEPRGQDNSDIPNIFHGVPKSLIFGRLRDNLNLRLIYVHTSTSVTQVKHLRQNSVLHFDVNRFFSDASRKTEEREGAQEGEAKKPKTGREESPSEPTRQSTTPPTRPTPNQVKPPPPAVNNRDEIEHTVRMMEMTLENDTDFGYCGDGAEEALDNAWLSLAEKVQICRKIRGLE